MTSLVYAPEVEVHIALQNGTIIDVSNDIQRTSTRRVINGVSSFDIDLLNWANKYDGLFQPMDRIVVYMRRVRRVAVFAGYLDSVPIFSAKPTSVHLRASCTLKRIQNFLWDPNSGPARALYGADSSRNNDLSDGGMAKRTINLLHKVAGWSTEQIHIGAVPTKWFEIVKDVADRLAKEAEILAMITSVGSAGYTSGTNPIEAGQTSIAGIGPGTGTLPDFAGKISSFGGPGGGAYGNMALTGESGTHPADNWYCAMRWPYLEYRGGDIMPVRGVDLGKAKGWWKNRRVLVVATKTGRAVCLRAADWGPGGVPSADRRIIDVSPAALKALGIGTDDEVHVAFAPAGMNLGVQAVKAGGTPSSSAQAGAGLSTKGVSASIDWGDPGSSSYGSNNIVSISAGGVTVKVNKHAAARFAGFLNDLAASGFKIHQGDTGGWVVRPITGGTGYSNHAYGAAVDINWTDNPYVTSGTRPHTMPDSLVRTLCAKWGLYWGGDYNSIKDYMHVEVIGAPRTPKTDRSPHTEIEAGGVPTGSAGDPGDTSGGQPDINGAIAGALFNLSQWGSTDFGSSLLGGIKALMNDEPLMPTVTKYMSAALRDYCSAPNGDFIAWFPDYFGHWGTAGKLVIQDVELLQSFSVGWSDENLKTHVFITSATTGFEGYGDAATVTRQLETSGIASVEFPEMMQAFFGESPALYKDNAKAYLNRMGARVYNEAMDNITGGRQEFFFACMRFMQNWAQQYSCTFDVTFMPEAFPGMLACFPQYGVQCYIAEVSHNTDADGGFTTQISGQAWSTIGNSKVKFKAALPKGAPL